LSRRYLIAIPVFNEEAHLASVLRETRCYANDILVIDDGSTDATPELLADEPGVAVIRHARNRGYGASLSDAFAFARRRRYDWLITMDCDEQHEPSYIPKFMAASGSGEHDIVSGSRYLEVLDDGGSPPPDRRAINRRITRMLNCQLGFNITDAFCGFKAYRVPVLSHLNITVAGYGMPLQLWVQAWRAGLGVTELPVRLIYNDPSRHFGGSLDDPTWRYKHYLQVYDAEMAAESPTTRAESPARRAGSRTGRAGTAPETAASKCGASVV